MSKDAKSLMEKGDFADAVTTWDKVLQKDPNDEEALRLRRVSQDELLNVDLVTLKGLLDSHQTMGAFDHLRKLNSNRKNWNLGINHNSALYLRQQTERLYGQYLELVGQETKLQHPLKALYLEKTYRDLLPSEIAPEEKASKDLVQHEGTAQCDELELVSRPNENLRLYAQVFCKTFGKSIVLSSANQQKLADALIKLPTIASQIKGLSDLNNQMISHSLSSVFEHLPAFSAKGTHDSNFEMIGEFTQQQSSAPIELSHSYTVQIPYTEYHTVTNMRSHPYTDTEQRCDAKGICRTESVTKYHEVEETNQVSETRYRAEPHIYNFMGTKLDQTIKFSVHSNLKSSLLSVGLPLEDRFDESLQSYHQNLPDIGLKAQVLNLKTKEQWLGEELPKISQAIDAQFQQLWLQKHCQALAKLTKWKQADHVFECYRSPLTADENLVKNWFLAETGLTPQNAAMILGPLNYL
jgi:tetratricopeptide (TPR) repeat protein